MSEKLDFEKPLYNIAGYELQKAPLPVNDGGHILIDSNTNTYIICDDFGNFGTEQVVTNKIIKTYVSSATGEVFKVNDLVFSIAYTVKETKLVVGKITEFNEADDNLYSRSEDGRYSKLALILRKQDQQGKQKARKGKAYSIRASCEVFKDKNVAIEYFQKIIYQIRDLELDYFLDLKVD